MATILGIDPGLSKMGLALVRVNQEGERVLALDVLRTEKSHKKRHVLASEDNVRRIQELAAALAPWFDGDVVAVCAESQSWPRSLGSATKTAMAWGIIGTILQRRRLPSLQASPQQVKAAVTGRKTASKEQVQAALEKRYGPLDWPSRKADREHCADALAAIVACLDSEVIRMARRIR
jgi:crossover junction endodeoxyribonuclease RuvC